MNMKKLAPLFILLAGILWGMIGIFVRPLNGQGLSSMDIVAIRAYVTTISMALVLLIADRKLFRIRLKDLYVFAGTGICSILFFNFCYFTCMSLTSLSVAAILLYTAPAIVMVLSFFFFGEMFSKRKLLALVMTFLGCVLVTGVLESQSSVSPIGILTGLGAGFGYALYSIFGRVAIDKGYKSLTVTFYTFLMASAGSFFLSDTKKIIQVTGSGPKIGLLCVMFGIVCTVLPYLTYTIGLRYVENGLASIIASIEPVAATLLGIFVFHEQVSISGVAGMVLVIAGLLLISLF